MNEVAGRLDSAEIYTQAIAKLRGQVWLALMLLNLAALLISRFQRFREGVTPTPLAAVLTWLLAAIFIGGIVLRNTRYIPYLQTAYLVILHFLAPLSILFFGGVNSFGEINLFLAIMVSILFGFRRWMLVPLTVSGGVVVYVIYLGFVGRAGRPFFQNEAYLFSFKLVAFTSIMLLTFFLATQFYRRLLESYANFSAEQDQVNAQLQANAALLTQTTQSLRQSRQQIVTARAEERRRLRRDLHDGLGPTLAAQVFRVGAARNLYQTKPNKADSFLNDVETSLVGTMDQVKQLVDYLRPAVLDQLGLAGAIQSHINTLEVPFAIHFEPVDLPENIAAAAEVAIWRIAQTSIDNVAKHANASTCWLTLAATDNSIRLTIIDNGDGLPANLLEGVGLTSMRERTAELQGSFSITQRQPSGTIVTAQVSLEQEAIA